MSTTRDTTTDPRDDPEAFIERHFDGLEHVVKEIAEGDFGTLSDDAEAVLDILGYEEGED